MVGDVVFFKENNSLISKIIAKVTASQYTHVGLIVSEDLMTGEVTVIESNRFVKTSLKRLNLDSKIHSLYTIEEKSDEVNDKIVQFAMNKVGTEYDYLQVVGIFISLILKGKRCGIFDDTNKMICSELIDIAYLKAGVKRKNMENFGNVTPQELLKYYPFIKIEREV